MNQNWPNTHTYKYSPIPSLLDSTGVSVRRVPVTSGPPYFWFNCLISLL